MRQFARFKRQHPDCVLFFRMGDFYEMFNEDALLAHRVLGITLTQRTEGVPMAGVPHHAVEAYIRRMIDAGHRVAVCDQVQDPREAKGIVDRAVTRVLTPGTLVDETLLDEGRANQVAALHEGPDCSAVLALIELSTGRFALHRIGPGRALDEIVRLAPSELAFAENDDGATPPLCARVRDLAGCALTPRPAWHFRPSEAREALCTHFGVTTLSGFGLDDDEGTRPAGALLRYLRETQAREGDAAPFPHLRPPRLVGSDQTLQIDAVSLKSLEIEQTIRAGRVEGSLLSIMQRARTAMGKRLLRHWLCFPLRDAERIRRRQDVVAALVEDDRLAHELRSRLDGVQDLARIAGRAALGRATPRDMVAIGSSVLRVEEIAALLETTPALARDHRRLVELLAFLSPLAASIRASCVDSPPPHLREGGLFRDGIDDDLDECRGLRRDANEWLARYQAQLIDDTAIPSLKVGYNKVFGYYIEITNAHRDKVPAAFARKQTLKNAERYITDELKTFEEKVTTAETRAIEREKALFEALCARVAARSDELTTCADLVARLDVLASFADVASRCGYVRPELTREPRLDIRAGRHPVLDRTLEDRFVPNDCRLRCEGADGPLDEGAERGAAAHSSLALITGPNMAGKSTYIRQVALIVLLAHTGSFVPADAATIGLTDRIFTRIGASDELHTGQSTFMVEMTETANILHHATERSLVILDEIGRGTSTLDGLSLAWAIAETLAEIGCRTLFATHYHELTSLADRIDAITNLQVAVREWGDEIVFLHRIQPGRTDRSYGIHVARIAGLPGPAVERAKALLETLTVETEAVSAKSIPGPAPSAQLGLFTEYLDHPAVAELRAIRLEKMTPMEAFDALRRLRELMADT
jgi:DNA mismatch repair protein MutS